jgi:hypothetical protein
MLTLGKQVDIVDAECQLLTTGFLVFAESGVPLGDGPFPLGEAFAESLLSAKASRRTCTGEAPFAESLSGPSQRICAERHNYSRRRRSYDHDMVSSL